MAEGMFRTCRRFGFPLTLRHRGCKILLCIGIAQILCTSLIYLLVVGSQQQTGEIEAQIQFSLENPIANFQIKQSSSSTPSPSSPSTKGTDSKFAWMSKHAQSAYARAKSEQCKNVIVETERKMQQGLLYQDIILPGSCPDRNVSNYRYIGCFRDNVDSPDLDATKEVKLEKNSPQRCVEHCYNYGFPYAGVQGGDLCFCGVKFGRHGALPSSSCNRPCKGDGAYRCGGNLANSVYKVDVGAVAKFATPKNVKNNTRDNPVNEPARIAFILSLNGRATRQIGRLLRLIYKPQHFYYIHVDTRLAFLNHELSKLTKDLSNVYVATGEHERFSTIWGGASLLTMLLSSYQYLINRADWNWDFVVNLSETDMPIRPVEEMAQFLGENRGLNFILTHTSKTDVFLSKQGMKYTFVECEHRMWRLHERPLPRGIRMYGASDWVTLSHEFVVYLLGAIENEDPLLAPLRHYFSYTLLPAESFFHTVLMNSEFCDRTANGNLRLVNWQRTRGCRCQQKAIVDWCGCSPNDFLEKDLKTIKQFSSNRSPNFFFARKFEETIDQGIVNHIEIDLLNSIDDKTPALDHFWLNEFSSGSESTSSTNFAKKKQYYNAFAEIAIEKLPSQQSDKECPIVNLDEITNIHSLRIKNEFNGLLIEFSTDFDFRFEAFLQYSFDKQERDRQLRESVDTINNDSLDKLFRMWGYRVAFMEVGSDFDVKEGVFRNSGSLLSTNQSGTCLSIVWEKVAKLGEEITSTTTKQTSSKQSKFSVELTVALTSPDGIVSTAHSKATPEDLVSCVGSESLYKMLKEAGVYSIKVKSAGDKYPVVDFGNEIEFLVLSPASQNSRKNIDLLTSRFWSLSDICMVDGDLKTGLRNCFSGEYLKQCKSTDWSSHRADFKATPLFAHQRTNS